MRLNTVSIKKGMTISLGGHNFTKVEVEMGATLDDADTFETDLDNLTELVNRKLAQEVEKAMPKRQPLMEKKMEKKKV
jgi:hypothetical protein